MANPNPNRDGLKPAWEAGQSGNPSGKTSEQKTRELRNAEKAAEIRGKMLSAMAEAYENMSSSQLIEQMDPQALKMLKDAEDRGFGAPVQAHVSPDGSMSNPREVLIVAKPVKDAAED